MGRKAKREYADDEMIGLPPAHISGAGHRILVATLKTMPDGKGKPMKLGKFLDKLIEKTVTDIRDGKRVKI